MYGRVPNAKEAELLTGEFLYRLEGYLKLVFAKHILARLHLDGQYMTLVTRFQL